MKHCLECLIYLLSETKTKQKNRLNIFPEILKKSPKYQTLFKYLENSSEKSLIFYRKKNIPILNPLAQPNFLKSLSVDGVEGEDSGASMLPASAIFKICSFSAFVIWNTFFKWEIAKLYCFWHKI